jgi:hypothetical protein
MAQLCKILDKFIYLLHFSSENFKVRVHMKDKGTDGRIILKWISRKQGRIVWT